MGCSPHDSYWLFEIPILARDANLFAREHSLDCPSCCFAASREVSIKSSGGFNPRALAMLET